MRRNLHISSAVLVACAITCSPSIVAQAPAGATAKQPVDDTGRSNSPFSRSEADLPKGPAPRLGNHPDLSGYWVPSHAKGDKPVGNLGKDYPAYKLPFTPEGEKAHKFNVEHTVDPEALCVVGGLPRHNASGLPFQLLQGQDHAVFLYWYTTYRLVPFDGRKHGDDPDPSFFGEEIGSWDGDTFVVDSTAFKQERTWADENADPHSDAQHVVERWTRPDLGHLHVEMVVDDPKFYKEPVHYQRTWLLGKPGDEVREYSCAEDNVDAPHLGPGPGLIGCGRPAWLSQAGAPATAAVEGSSRGHFDPRLAVQTLLAPRSATLHKGSRAVLRFIDRQRARGLALIVLVVSNAAIPAQTQQKPEPPAGVREICTVAFDKNTVRPARVQNDALPCLEQSAHFLREHPDRKLVLVGAKDPKRDHEPAYVDPAREEEDISGFAVRLEDLSDYRAVNTKWYLVHDLHSDARRILPTTVETYFAQSVTLYDVPSSADFNHNFLNTTKINEAPCTIQPCYSPDEETLKAQPRPPIVAGAQESTAESSEERHVLAAQRRQARLRTTMNGEEEKLAPLPPIPTPDKPATVSIIPQ